VTQKVNVFVSPASCLITSYNSTVASGLTGGTISATSTFTPTINSATSLSLTGAPTGDYIISFTLYESLVNTPPSMSCVTNCSFINLLQGGAATDTVNLTDYNLNSSFVATINVSGVNPKITVNINGNSSAENWSLFVIAIPF